MQINDRLFNSTFKSKKKDFHYYNNISIIDKLQLKTV